MNLYGVFFGTKWAMTTNKRRAIVLARENQGLVTVHYGPKARWAGPWDAPTLRAVSDVVADFYPLATD